MPKRPYKPEEIIKLRREAEVLINEGLSARQAAGQLGINGQTFSRWRKEHGGMRIEQVIATTAT